MRDSLAVEKHYRVKELADLWGFSENTIIKLFSNEDGVLRLESPTGKRKYATLSIPETVAIRVHERLGHQALKAASARRNPFRVVHLRNLDARMTKQPRYIANGNVTQQSADGEGVAQSVGTAIVNTTTSANALHQIVYLIRKPVTSGRRAIPEWPAC